MEAQRERSPASATPRTAAASDAAGAPPAAPVARLQASATASPLSGQSLEELRRSGVIPRAPAPEAFAAGVHRSVPMGASVMAAAGPRGAAMHFSEVEVGGGAEARFSGLPPASSPHHLVASAAPKPAAGGAYPYAAAAAHSQGEW
jgi:hypothetical protein